MKWVVAQDISERIQNLRKTLGGGDGPVLQEELARRAGVRASQVSQWERGAQRPSRSRLERWAEREGWSVEMFREGAPMPSELLKSDEQERGAGSPPPGVAAEKGGLAPREILARFYGIMAEAGQQGRPLPPELAVLMHSMFECATSADAPDRTSPDDALAPQGEDVPDW